MRSLSQLNTRGQTTLNYTDNRAAQVIFDRTIPTNQSLTTAVGQSHILQPGIEINEIIQPNVVNVYYEIDVSSVPGATVTWTSPPGTVVITNPSTGKYRASNIDSAADWQAVKAPTINIPALWEDNFTYTATIYYEPGLTKSWNNSVAVTVTAFINSLSLFTASLTGVANNPASINSEFNLNAQNTRVKLMASNMSANGGVMAVVARNIGPITVNVSSSFSFTGTLTGLQKLQPTNISSTAAASVPGRRIRYHSASLSSLFSSSTTLLNKIPNPTTSPAFGKHLAVNSSYYAISGGTNSSNTSLRINLYNLSNNSYVRSLTPTSMIYNDLDLGSLKMSNTYTAVGASVQSGSFIAGTVRVYNNSTGSLVSTINNPTSTVGEGFGQVISMNDSYVAVCSYLYDAPGSTNTGIVYVFSTTTGSLVRTINCPYTPAPSNERWGFTMDISGDRLLLMGNAGTMYVYSLTSGSQLYTVANDIGLFNFKATDSYIIYDNSYTSVKLLDITNGSFIRTMSPPIRGGLYTSLGAISWASDNYFMASDTVYKMSNANRVIELSNPSSAYDPETWGYTEFQTRAGSGSNLIVSFSQKGFPTYDAVDDVWTHKI